MVPHLSPLNGTIKKQSSNIRFISKMSNKHNNSTPKYSGVPVVQGDPAKQDMPTTEPTKLFSEENVAYGGRNPVVDSHLNTVAEYINAMKPNTVITDTDGIYWQGRLYNTILGILRLPNVQDMIDGMDGLLAYFAEYRQSSLNYTNTQRFLDKWMVDETTRDLFGHLCLILSTFSEPAKREFYGYKMRLTGEDSIIHALDQESRNRLINYLNRYIQV